MTELKKYTQEEIDAIIAKIITKHKKFFLEDGGDIADFSESMLRHILMVGMASIDKERFLQIHLK